MAYTLYKIKNSPYWYVDFGTHQGRRTRTSAGTEEKKQAEAFAKHRQAELWRAAKLGEKPSVTWDYAVIEWLKAHEHKRSIEDDKQRLRVLSQHLRGVSVSTLTAVHLRTVVEGIPGIAASTRNRYMAVARGILNYAHLNEWRGDSISVHSFPEPRHRIRYLVPTDAARLLAELPDYLRAMCEFSLATGLRESNVRLLEWSCVDLGRAIAWVHGDQTKNGKDLTVPLNAGALSVLQAQQGKHWKWVFPYQTRPIYRCTNDAWYAALNRAKITNFRWHDLRHTWASWHVQAGTSLYDLKTLGGWSSITMVEKYAHLSRERIAASAGNIDGIWLTSGKLGGGQVMRPTPKPNTGAGVQAVLPQSGADAFSDGGDRADTQSASTIIDLRDKVPARDVPESAKTDESRPRTDLDMAKKWQSK